jgi:16S rRNA processing protein RimM
VARLKRPASSPPPRSNPALDRAARPFTGDASRLVVMGRVVGSFGVKGWIKVKPFSEKPDALAEHDRWAVRTHGGWHEMDLEDFELHSKGPVAKLAGVDAREGAEALRGAEVAVPREALGKAEEDSLYQVDLIGLEVVEEEGAVLGRVEGFFEAGDTSVMVVAGGDGRERLIPFVAGFVKSVEPEAKRVVVDWKADYDA